MRVRLLQQRRRWRCCPVQRLPPLRQWPANAESLLCKSAAEVWMQAVDRQRTRHACRQGYDPPTLPQATPFLPAAQSFTHLQQCPESSSCHQRVAQTPWQAEARPPPSLSQATNALLARCPGPPAAMPRIFRLPSGKGPDTLAGRGTFPPVPVTGNERPSRPVPRPTCSNA